MIAKIYSFIIIIPLAILEIITVVSPKKILFFKPDISEEKSEGIYDELNKCPVINRLLGVLACIIVGILFYWTIKEI